MKGDKAQSLTFQVLLMTSENIHISYFLRDLIRLEMRTSFSKVSRVVEVADVDGNLMLLSHEDNLHKKDVYLFFIRVEFIFYNPILTMKIS